MKSLGTNGRFGNQLFQYAFLRFYARHCGAAVETPSWVGQNIFGHADPKISRDLPTLSIICKEHLSALYEVSPPVNVDLHGYFQETGYYSDDKNFFRSLFVPRFASELLSDWLPYAGRPVIGVHLRYGDYGSGIFYETPLKWVLERLEREWNTLNNPLLYIASDDPRAVNAFTRYQPVTWRDIFSVTPSVAASTIPEYYYDFFSLSMVNHMLIVSNSSFSFAAAMINKNCTTFLRPGLKAQKLVLFEPWNSSVLLRESSPWLTFLAGHPHIRRIYNFVHRAILFRSLQWEAMQ